jgi:hypothetical protein
MGIVVPIIGSASPTQGNERRGRPRIYNFPTLPVSFRVPAAWREVGSKKARGQVNLTQLFAIYYYEFLWRPVEETQAFIQQWEASHGSIMEDYDSNSECT